MSVLSGFSFFSERRTKWFCYVHIVVIFRCFILNFIFLFVHFSHRKTPKKPDTAKTPKGKNAKKKKKRTKKTVSAIAFTNSVLQFFGVGVNFHWGGYWVRPPPCGPPPPVTALACLGVRAVVCVDVRRVLRYYLAVVMLSLCTSVSYVQMIKSGLRAGPFPSGV